MTPARIRFWYFLHKWPSLICTAFLLMLCITGLPLIFHDEIDHALGYEIAGAIDTRHLPPASADRLAEAALRLHPQEFVQFIVWDRELPDIVFLSLSKTRDAPLGNNRVLIADARTAEILGPYRMRESPMYILLKLHADMFLGLPGKLFLGAMGLLFVVAILSGVLLYAPFMRKLSFGTLRLGRSPRLRWLDWHNFLGIVVLAWVFVVGLTGIINTWNDLARTAWQRQELADMTRLHRDKPLPDASALAPLERVLATARTAAPGMTPAFIAFPGAPQAGNHHYAIFMRGASPLTERLLKPVLIDAETGELTDARTMPWYMTALFVSQPLHFGDYGGLPLKILWALLDLAAIAVLGSGLYLWLSRRKSPIEARLAEIETGGGA